MPALVWRFKGWERGLDKVKVWLGDEAGKPFHGWVYRIERKPNGATWGDGRPNDSWDFVVSHGYALIGTAPTLVAAEAMAEGHWAGLNARHAVAA